MFQKRKTLILVGAFIFSFGMLSMGYAFWTDSLELEGNANVNLSIRVIDDIEETTSPEALVIMEEPAQNNGGSGVSSEPDSSPTISDPVVTPPAEDPVVTPSAEDPVVTPPAEDPVVTPPAEDPVVTPPAEDPVMTPSAEDPADTPSAAETPASSSPEGTEGSSESTP